MGSIDILFPVMALIGWTFLVLLLIPIVRTKEISAGRLSPKDFAGAESERVSMRVSLPNRNYMNLLEMPVIFYVLCVIAFVAGQANDLMVAIAWVFVALRIVHSIIHLTFNRVFIRFLVFLVAKAALIALWGLLLISLIEARGAI